MLTSPDSRVLGQANNIGEVCRHLHTPPYHLQTPNFVSSLVVNLSLITAIGPRINNYLSGLQAGLLGPQISEQEVRRYRRQLLKPVSRASKTSKSSTSALHQPSKEGEPPQPLPTDTPCSQSTKSQNAWDYSRQGKDLDEIFQLSQIASNDIITNVKKP